MFRSFFFFFLNKKKPDIFPFTRYFIIWATFITYYLFFYVYYMQIANKCTGHATFRYADAILGFGKDPLFTILYSTDTL